MKCPIKECQELLEIVKESTQYFSTIVNFKKCKCERTFLRRLEFYPSGIISQDLLYIQNEDGTYKLFKELYLK